VEYSDFTSPSKPLKTLSTTIKEAVITTIAITLIQAMILIAFVDFFALKYRQAKSRFMRGN
jgi:hypothetical protein